MTPKILPQGDPALLDTPTAQALLDSRELARLAYLAHDGTPRVLPMLFQWTGSELVFSTFAGAHKISALRARPSVAVTIDRAGPPPEVLLLRGEVTVDDVDGIVPEYRQAQIRYGGEEHAQAAVAEVDRPGVQMARISLVPTWVSTLDFTERFPGGTGPEEFARRGQVNR